jgi:hypothetical protein
MSLKKWMVDKVNGGASRPGPSSRRRVAPSLQGTVAPGRDEREPIVGDIAESHDRGRGLLTHLGPYAPLIVAIREELEHFVESQLRLHLAIAERDRYILTAIEVDCDAHDEEAALLQRFIDEFKPEQIKRYLARDVIAGLRNASAIDLSQFAGLIDAGAARTADEDDPYRALIADLQKGSSGAQRRGFAVTLVGRWVQDDAIPESAQARARGGASKQDSPTPLAGRTLALDIADAAGDRRIELPSVVPGRRYVIGKDSDCDIVVDGVYASRRHCEIWFDRQAWWVADAGSTNGIRVEHKGAVARSDPHARDRVDPLEAQSGATLILSAFAQGEPRLYPQVTLHPAALRDANARAAKESATPATPLAPSIQRSAAMTIAARMASGLREADLSERSLPFGIGRSRNQALVIDSAHSDVSGKHIEIVAVDAGGAWVVVHGDNGVIVGGAPHGAGTKFHWKRGETMELGRANTRASACTLTLSLGA